MNFKIRLLSVFVLILSASTIFAQKNDPIIMTINNEKVTKSEFLRTYLKNNEAPKYDKASLDEYLALFTNFKIKVIEAEALGYDTIPSLKKEFNGYKEQLAQPYLVDSKKSDELIHEAYDRMKYEVRASHILISVKKDASPADTLKAYNKALALKKRIDKGEDFGAVASGAGGSEDPSVASNKGDLGYFTAFHMVYPFETAAFNTPIGEVSMPVRTSYGYHIVKVADKRPARGTITTAHIMIVAKKTDDRSDLEKAEKKITEIYEKLQAGEDFGKLARLYSDDQGSKSRDGEIAPFGSGTNQRMVTEFEDAAFALKNNGDYSEPFQTDYGFHIVKRLDYKPLGTLKELMPQIKQKINQGDRSKQSETAFISKLKKENKFSDKSAKGLVWFYNNVDSTIFTKKWNKPEMKKSKVLFKYNKQKFKSQEFYDFLASQRYNTPMQINNFINQEFERWQSKEIIANEKSHLEEKHPEYKAIVQEYHDGILLNEVMKDKVWDKAIKDSTGLQAYFDKNISKYQWPARIEASIYSSVDLQKVQEAQLLTGIDTLNMADVISKINVDSELNISGEKAKFIQENTEALKDQKLQLGKNAIYQSGDKYYLVIVHEFIPAGPKKLSETRGAVIQDYQEALDKEWLEELQGKHNVKVNKEVLYSIGE